MSQLLCQNHLKQPNLHLIINYDNRDICIIKIPYMKEAERAMAF